MIFRLLFSIRKIMLLPLVIFGCYLCLRYSAECAAGIKKGILFCLEALVPSLFLFMALSAFTIRSGAVLTASRPFRRLSRVLFGLDESGFAVILLSMLGGYPVGARCIAMMAQRGTMSDAQARKAAAIAVCAGPGFLMNYVGGALLQNRRAGGILLCAEITGVLVTGFITGRLLRCEPTSCSPAIAKVSGENLLIDAVKDASAATFQMCSMVVVCTAITEIIAVISPTKEMTDILSALTEITEGCHRMCGSYPLHLIAFFIGFGGLSVHLQIFAGLGKVKVHKGIFFLIRCLQGIITAAAAYSYLMIFPIEQRVFNSTDASLSLGGSATLAGSAALVLSSLCFLGSVHQKIIRR